MPENKDNTAPTKPEPADLEAFDLDGFIEGIVQPTKVVAVAQDRALGQRIQEAMQTVIDLEQAERDAKAEGRPSKRRAATAESPELEAARNDLTALEQQASSTFVFVRVEGLTRSTRKQAIKDATGNADDDAFNLAALAYSAQIHKNDPRTHPDAPGRTLTLDQWGVFAEAVGYLQWDAVMDGLREVTAVGVSPDFSQPASPSPGGDTPSKS